MLIGTVTILNIMMEVTSVPDARFIITDKGTDDPRIDAA